MEWQHLRLQRPFEIEMRPEGSKRKWQEKINEATQRTSANQIYPL